MTRWHDYRAAPTRLPRRPPITDAPSTHQSPPWSQRWSWWCFGPWCFGGGGGVCLATSCLWAGRAGSTCLWAGAFAACLAGAGVFAVIAAGGLPFAGAPPFGAAAAVPQRAPQSANAIISFLSVLFMVVSLSSLRASLFSRLHKARKTLRRLLTTVFYAYDSSSRGAIFPRRFGIMRGGDAVNLVEYRAVDTNRLKVRQQ